MGPALDYVLAQAISQYLDLGAGLPTRPAVHDMVRRHDNTASVLYVDNDPVVINHLWALTCTADPCVEAITADLPQPAAVLNSLSAAAPLKPLPEPVELDQYRVRRQARVGGMINEYRLVA